MPDQRYDRLVLATISVLRTLVFELSRRGKLDQAEFVAVVRETAIAHRQRQPFPIAMRWREW
jgi:hypothetical protein